MKVLVLGSKGQLGLCLADQLDHTEHEVIYTSRTEIDIGQLESTKEKIRYSNPDVVINASAYTAVDQAESDKEAADLINHLAVASIAEICADLHCWLIHISTDYVFDGLATKPYLETDNPNPQGSYGLSKLNGEIKIQASTCKFIIIRTTWVFSEYGNNFMKTMLILGTDQKEISVVGDQVGCPTYAQDLAKAIVSVVSRVSNDKLVSGIYHYSGDLPCTWYEFAESIFCEAKKLGYSIPDTLIPINTNEYPTPASRPAYSVLDNSKFENQFGFPASNWHDGIKETISAIDILI